MCIELAFGKRGLLDDTLILDYLLSPFEPGLFSLMYILMLYTATG